MGHRAYVLYEREDGRFNVHYSHWGAYELELVGKITEETPLGGDNTEPEFLGAFMSMLDDATGDMEVGGYLTEAQQTTAVEADPEATGVEIDQFLGEASSVHIEAIYVVDRDFTVHGYDTVWLGSDDHILYYSPRWVDDRPVSLAHESGYATGLRDCHDDMGYVVDQLVERYADRLDEHLLAHSPGVTDRHVRDHPGAFLKLTGITRGTVSSFDDPPRWSVPDDFAIQTTTGMWTPAE